MFTGNRIKSHSVRIAETIESLRAQPQAALLQGANDRLPGFVATGLVLLVAWQAAGLLWALLPGKPTYDWSNRVPVSAMPVTPTDNTGAGVDFGRIAAAKLFGEADAEPPPVATVSAPETRLNLKLRGTIAADDETIAHAIIADSGNKTNVYFVEDPIPGGATLHEVYPDRVILKRGGAFETLRLPKTSSGGVQTSSAPVSMPPGVMSGGMDARPPGEPGGYEAFTQVVRPQPFMPNGELKGYRVYPGRDRRAFAALGLRPGDLVTEINGQPLNNIQTGLQVFRSIGESPQMTVTIERNGTPMVLSVDSSQFNNASGASR